MTDNLDGDLAALPGDGTWSDESDWELGQVDGFDGAADVEHMPVLAIVGRPNVGKSSLLNALAGSSRVVALPENWLASRELDEDQRAQVAAAEQSVADGG